MIDYSPSRGWIIPESEITDALTMELSLASLSDERAAKQRGVFLPTAHRHLAHSKINPLIAQVITMWSMSPKPQTMEVDQKALQTYARNVEYDCYKRIDKMHNRLHVTSALQAMRDYGLIGGYSWTDDYTSALHWLTTCGPILIIVPMVPTMVSALGRDIVLTRTHTNTWGSGVITHIQGVNNKDRLALHTCITSVWGHNGYKRIAMDDLPKLFEQEQVKAFGIMDKCSGRSAAARAKGELWANYRIPELGAKFAPMKMLPVVDRAEIEGALLEGDRLLDAQSSAATKMVRNRRKPKDRDNG